MLLLSTEEYEKEPEIHKAFKNFIYKQTGWKIGFSEGKYYGITAERYKIFRAGYNAYIINSQNIIDKEQE